MINVWVGVSLIHSRPSTTSVNRRGSASRSGRCGFIVSGVALRSRDRARGYQEYQPELAVRRLLYAVDAFILRLGGL